jgi:hypothetical protein
MPTMSPTLPHAIVTELGFFLEPIIAAVDSPFHRRQLFEALGWNLEAIPGVSLENVDRALTETVKAYDAAVTLANSESGDTLETLQTVLKAVDAVWTGVEIFQEVSSELDTPGLGDLRHVAQELLNVLSVQFLRSRHASLYELAILLTLVRLREVPEPVIVGVPPRLIRIPHVRPELRLDRIVPLLRDPVGTLRQAHIGDDGLQTVADAQHAADSIFPHLGGLLATFGVPVYYGLDPTAETSPDFGPVGNQLAAGILAIFLPPYQAAEGVRAGGQLMLALSPAERGNLGLVVIPTITEEYSNRFDGWTLTIALAQQIAAFAYGPRGLTMPPVAGIANVSGALSLTQSASLETDPAAGAPADEPPEPAMTIGGTGSTRLEVDSAGLSAYWDLDVESQDFGFDAAAAGALVIGRGDGDGFLQTVLPASGLRAQFNLALGWSRARGVHLGTGAGLEATIPIHASLAGIVNVDSAFLALTTREGHSDVSVVVAVTGGLQLGPVTVTIDQVGLSAELDFPPRGNLGPVNLTGPRFKPPTGAGLALDAGAIVGGGYLSFNAAKGEYSGILQLEIQDTLTVTAIGLLSTPSGNRPGYSLLILIAAEGFMPIQLGWGFTLNGIGGLVGINRNVVVDVLRAGIKTGTLDSVLFPDDPIRNAAQIISDLRTIFPPVPRRYVLGPMAILGWGTPTILTAELAVILTLPAPIRLIVLGRFRVLLPSAEETVPPVIRIQMDAIGVVNVDRREASIDATLFDSRFLQYVLSGDMALRASWGSAPTLILAVGGFNPRYAPPPGFPSLDRIAVSLTEGDTPRLRMDAYLAITANTVQIGAQVDLYARESGFSVHGEIGFDALFELSPFSFVADVGGRVTVKRHGNKICGARLDLTVTGPRPLQARGRATFEFLGMKQSVGFRATFGSGSGYEERAATNIERLVADALGDRRNWSAQTPPDGHPLVTLRRIEPGVALFAHPASAVTFRQRLVPLGVEVSRFGGVAPAGARRITIDRVEIAGRAVSGTPVLDAFAPGQFMEMTDDEKLSAPGFEQYQSGASASGDAIATGRGVPLDADLGYETITVDSQHRPLPPAAPRPGYVVRDVTLPKLTRVGTAGRSKLGASGSGRFRGPRRTVEVRDAAFTVVDDASPAGSTSLGDESRLTYLDAATTIRSLAASAARERLAIVSMATLRITP